MAAISEAIIDCYTGVVLRRPAPEALRRLVEQERRRRLEHLQELAVRDEYHGAIEVARHALEEIDDAAEWLAERGAP